MLSGKYRFLLAGGTLGLAIWLGYRGECRVMDAAGSKPVTFQSVVRRVLAPKSRTDQIDKLNRIRHGIGRTYPTQREAAEAWEIIRGMTVDDVKACLAEIPQTPPRPGNEMLTVMLFFRWGQIDPGAAAREASQPPYDQSYSTTVAVATAWTTRDPEGALRWAATVPEGHAKYVVGNAAGRMLVSQNAENAVARASAEFPQVLTGVVVALAQKSGVTAEARRKLISELAELPDQEPLRVYLNRLAQSLWGEGAEKAASLLEEVEQSGIPADVVAPFRDQMKGHMRPKDSLGAIEWMQKPESNTTEQQQRSYYSSWSANEPDKAIAWASQAGRVDLISQTVKDHSRSLLRSNWQPGGGDFQNSYAKALVPQFDSWRKLDPTAADAWLQTMPADIRTHLSPDHATR